MRSRLSSVPARYDDAVKMAHLVKYLCVETYDEVAGTDFTRRYFPKMFFLIGEWEYRNNGTYILGTAEGGRKILLAGLNYLSDNIAKGPEYMNYFYFKTIHHEFTHIMNQTKEIPADFQLVTGDKYEPKAVGYLFYLPYFSVNNVPLGSEEGFTESVNWSKWNYSERANGPEDDGDTPAYKVAAQALLDQWEIEL